ncbi:MULTISPECIES: CRISPR-associated protein Csx18 [Aerosakkonema]|uniref:CRISPR-associated protein Csx18 n=1 Tax=Aerosakkonema TaxID=1246629 RepID=UPI0035B87840
MRNFISRSGFVRNLAVAIVNGGITLIILLIAPLGLAAVIFNTLLVVLGSFVTGTVADRVVGFLTPSQQAELLRRSQLGQIRQRDVDDIERF